MSLRWTGKDFEAVAELRRQLRQVEREIDNRTPGNVAGTAGQGLARIGSRPPTPSGLSATPASGRILLTWSAVNIADLMRYEVQVSTNAGMGAAETFYTGNNFFTYEKGITGTTYYLRVRAVNTAGVAGSYSNIVSTAPKVITSAEAPIAAVSPYVLVNTFAPTSDATSLTITGLTSTDYDVYHLDFFNMEPDLATNNRLYIEFYMDGALKTDAKYSRMVTEFDYSGPTHGQNVGTALSFINTSRSTAEFGVSNQGHGTIWFFPNLSTTADPKVIWRYSMFDGGGIFTYMYGFGTYDNSTLNGSWDGLKLYFGNTGNKFKSKIRAYLYGHKQSVS